MSKAGLGKLHGQKTSKSFTTLESYKTSIKKLVKYQVINFQEKFNLFTGHWSPKILAQMNDYHFKIAKIRGEFVWHSHPETDETFVVIAGKMQIKFRDSVTHLEAGEMLVVPKGAEHKPVAEEECHILIIELAGTLNTGDTGGDRTVSETEWI